MLINDIKSFILYAHPIVIIILLISRDVHTFHITANIHFLKEKSEAKQNTPKHKNVHCDGVLFIHLLNRKLVSNILCLSSEQLYIYGIGSSDQSKSVLLH